MKINRRGQGEGEERKGRDGKKKSAERKKSEGKIN